MGKINRLQQLIVWCLLVIILPVLVTAHKSSSETILSTELYTVRLGLIPAMPFENQEQEIFLTVEEIENTFPVQGLRVEFKIHKSGTDESSTYTVEEQAPGKYVLRHTFTKGNYMVGGELYENEKLITEVSQHVHVEPNGPSMYFWLFMLVAVVVGAIIASQSHKW